MNNKKPKINHIIFAEDDEDDRQFFIDVIEDYDPTIKLDIVKDGLNLMALLKNILADILFLDLDMPYKNGLECLVEMKGHPGMDKLPVVVFSSTDRNANIQTAYEMGAHLFLVKSPNYSSYAKLIKSALDLDWSHSSTIKEKYRVNNKYVAFT